MSTVTDIAMESTGVTLVKGDLMRISKARRLSRTTMQISARTYLQYPWRTGCRRHVVSVFWYFAVAMIAALAMSFSSISVIANASVKVGIVVSVV